MFKNKFIIPLILLAISFITFYRLLQPGYPSMMDDMHIFRLQQFDKCLQDHQIPCRYVPDAGFGYGYPLFNFYSPLPYASAEAFHLLGFSFINSIKIIFALIHIIGIFGMYFLASIYWGQYGGLLSAIIFLLAPYQAVDSYVRGAIAESMAINFVPWILFFIHQVINKKKYKILLSISIACLLLSHNLTSISFIPVFAIYSLYLFKKNHFKNLLSFSLHVLLGLGISAFFIFPALIESKFTTVDAMTRGYYYYVVHFATLKQLFISNFWGYSASMWGPIDGMSFQIGYLLWILPTLTLIYFIYQKKVKNNLIFIVSYFLAFFYIFLTHSKSTPIWIALPFMKFYQFPWRFLSVVIVLFSFLSGASLSLFTKTKIKNIVLITISIITIILNFSYFKEDIWYPTLTDQEKLSGAKYIEQSGAGLQDYWPKYGTNMPTEYAPSQPTSKNEVSFDSYIKKSNSLSFTASSKVNANITLPMVFFPNWKLYIDNNLYQYQLTPDLGLINFELPSGTHQISLKFTNTLTRTISNLLSIFSIITLTVLAFYYKNENKK